MDIHHKSIEESFTMWIGINGVNHVPEYVFDLLAVVDAPSKLSSLKRFFYN